ncbi:MAG: hypothetical protein PHS44_00585 [Candidatus Dojkabacteria bacterium]|nr:hypothetical protein [Candidatus Dojkabacteria bacterium]
MTSGIIEIDSTKLKTPLSTYPIFPTLNRIWLIINPGKKRLYIVPNTILKAVMSPKPKLSMIVRMERQIISKK